MIVNQNKIINTTIVMDRTKIRIRNQTKKTNMSTLESKRSISCREMQKDNPNSSEFLDEVKKIMDTARETSTTLNLEFRKYSDKPEMQMVYVDSKKMQKKLQEMQARINVNKYQMIVEVRKDPINNFSEKKPVKDEAPQENYKSLYKQYLKEEEKYGEPPQIINNPIISLYQFYDDEQKDWKESLKNKCLISRQVKRQSKPETQHSRIRKIKQEEESLSSSRSSKLLENEEVYQRMFEQFAQRNNKNEVVHQAPKAQKIILDRFQTKFYRCRQRKFQHLFDRLNDKQSDDEDRNPETQNKKKKSIKLKVPETCKKVYNAQNKLLEENLTNGLSRQHTKKLIIQFNKTILDMKATESKSQILPKGNIFKKPAAQVGTKTKNT